MFRRLINYIRTAFGMKAESMMDPSVQIEQAVQEARKQDQQLREQAARVIAHRSELQMKLERAVDAAAKAKQGAGQALVKVQEATNAGDTAAVEKWTRAAQALALDLETQERLVEGIKTQYGTAEEQADLAKKQVNANALRLRELTSKRMELLGKLEQAKMQESVNKALDAINRPMDTDAPSLTSIEDKINKRMALASAKSELEKNSLEGTQRELQETLVETAGMARLDALKAEMGMVTAAPAATGNGGAADSDLMLSEGGDSDAAKLQKLADEVPQEVAVEVEQDK